jgi:hypothetical protein
MLRFPNAGRRERKIDMLTSFKIRIGPSNPVIGTKKPFQRLARQEQEREKKFYVIWQPLIAHQISYSFLDGYLLIDLTNIHMFVSKIKPQTCEYKQTKNNSSRAYYLLSNVSMKNRSTNFIHQTISLKKVIITWSMSLTAAINLIPTYVTSRESIAFMYNQLMMEILK